MVHPLYVTELLLDPAQVEFSPDKHEFQEQIENVMVEFQTTVIHYRNLIADTYFDAFTRSADNDK